MTKRMKQFLLRAVDSKPGKGILVKREDRRIAGRAVSDGHGWMISNVIFIPNEETRENIK